MQDMFKTREENGIDYVTISAFLLARIFWLIGPLYSTINFLGKMEPPTEGGRI